jgi:hypothetical protein
MGKILDAIRKEQAQEHRAEVEKIVEPDPYDDKLIGSGGGFSRACAESAAQASRNSEAQAIREAKTGSVRSQESLKSFYDRHVKLLGRRRCDEILNEHDHR